MTEIKFNDGRSYRKVMKTFDEVEPGDVIEGPEGLVSVLDAYDEHVPEEMFEITFENGGTIEASGGHLFYVETENDIAGHHQRRKDGRKWLKNLSKESLEILKEWSNNDEGIEIMLSDFTAEIGESVGSSGAWKIARAAESVGPVSEINFSYKEIHSGVQGEGETIPAYDRAAIARQLLSFSRGSKWKTIVGKVITASQMFELNCQYWVPTNTAKET